MISADCNFKIGSTHKVCEDYAMKHTGMIGEEPLIISVVSDGCSSSKFTDIGARFICISFIRSVIELLQVDTDDEGVLSGISITNEMMEKLKKVRGILDIPLTMLDATAVGVIYYKKTFYIYMHGDGAVTVQRGSEKHHFAMKYSENAPYYMSYRLDPARDHSFELLNQRVTMNVNNPFFGAGTETNPHNNMIMNFLDTNEDIIVTVMSDGVESFNPLDPLPVFEVMEPLTAYKNLKGEFVQRRMNKFLKTAPDHYDDLSMAAICSTKEEKQNETD